MKRFNTLLFTFFFLFGLCAYTQWLPDVRLTNNTGISYTSYNRPGIAASGNVLHITWHDNRDGNTEVYYKRSTDAGTTWGSDMRITNNSANSEFPTIAVLGLNVYVVWHDGRDTINEIYFNKSTDAGITWGPDTRITFAPGESNFPVIAVSGSAMHIAWHDYRDGNAEIYYKQSTDAGASWSADIRMTVSAGISAFAQLSISGTAVHLIWQDNRHGDGEIYYARSSNSGVNWSTEARLTNSYGISAYPSISSSGSTVHLAWWDDRSYPAEIFYKKSADDGLNWGTDARLTNSSGASYDPFIYASGTLVHIVWIDSRDGNFDIYNKESSDAGTNWSIDNRITNNSAVSESNSMIVSGPKVHVLWQDNRDGNYEIYFKQNPIGNTLATVDSVSPKNKVSVPLNSDLKAYFNQDMNASTMDSNSVIFFGSMTGRKQGTFTYNTGEKSVSINPNFDFKYGELISTTLRATIKTGTDNFITPFVWSFTTMAKSSNIVFNEISNIAVGTNPYSVASGDLDNDGDIDLAVGNSPGSISIIINNGNGTFTKQNPDIIMGDSRRIITGDFDNDGDLDLAAGIGSLSSVQILTNNGNAVFMVTSTVPSGFCHDITTADFDGDGYLDIATSGWTENKIAILLNNRSGSITLSSIITTGSGVYEVIAGDFDSDGFIDIAAPNYYGNNCSIYRNNGTGNFTALSSVGVGSSPQGITVGDLDSDGDLDLSVTNYGTNNLNILKNNGNGSFTSTATIGTGANPWGINCADLDGDGDLDLVVCAGNTVYLYRNDGNGSFTFSSYAGQTGIPAPRTTIADFNKDGVLDIATADINANRTRIIVSLVPPRLFSPANNSTGNLNALIFSWNKSLGASNYRFQLAADSLFSSIIVNDSTLLGMDSLKSVSGLSPLTWYYWRLNSKSANGTSLWSDVWKFKTQGAPTEVVLNTPANNAINQPVSCTFVWYKAIDQVLRRNIKGTGSDEPENVANYWFEISKDSTFTSEVVRDSSLTDTTKDVTLLSPKSKYYWHVKAKNETGWGSFSSNWNFTTTYFIDSVSPSQNKVNVSLTSGIKAFFRGSLNGSTLDSNSISFFSSMTGRMRGAITYNSGSNSMQIVPNTSFKYGELISTTLDSGIKTSTGNAISPFIWSFTTLAKASNSVFNRIDTIIVGVGPTKIAAGDLDGDGDLDFAVTNGTSNTVSILKNNGSGIFTVSSETGVGITPDGIVMCDIDSDGDVDLAVANGASNSVSILKNNGTGSFVLSSSVGVGDAGGLASGDLDNDGDIDIAVTNRNSNYTSILKNNGTGIFTTSSTIAANSPQGITAGDFDNDGDLDLSIVEYWASRISIFKNDGAGTFALSSANGVGSNTDQVVAGDFNNDGDLDLAVTSNFSSISILENNGTGTFTVTNMGPSSTRGITTGDFDGDGYLDLAVNNFGSHTVSILRNSGSGTFILSSTIGASNLPIYITTGDFNNNGVLDLAVTNPYNSMITVLMNLTPPQLLSPANNSIGNMNALSFSWNKSLGASNYRFQLATDSLFSNIIVNDSTLLGMDSIKNVSGLSPLTWYYWRLNSKSVNGSSLWSDVWKFKTIGSPFQVTLISPANNAVNQPIAVNFRWSKAVEQMSPIEGKRGFGKRDNESDAISNYSFEIVTDTISMTNLLRDTTLTDTTKIVSGLLNLTDYFWRVKAKGELGWGIYSVWFRFTTIISASSAPVLVNPANGVIGQNITLTLVWNRLPTAESYRLQVSTDSLFTGLIVNDSAIADTTRIVSGLNPLTYYWWRVNAKNIGGTSAYSTTWKFKTMGAPTQVTLLTPLNNATNQAINLNFAWSRSSDMLAPWNIISKERSEMYDNESISKYWFDLVRDTSSMANLLRDTLLTDTSKTVSGLSYSTPYYWRAKAKNQIGWGAYSVWFKFTTSPPPPANVNLTIIPGGFYDAGSSRLNMKDTIRVYLVDSVSCLRVDSAKGVIDSVTYSMPISFSNAATGSYYMMVYHRNHLSIASRYSQGIVRGSTVSYDFTTDSTKTFGFNVIKVSTSPVRWAMIPGDGNRDGFVDATDQLVWINLNGLDGYLDADFNGDSFVDATDQLIWITYNGTSIFLPCGFLLDPVTLYPVKNTPDYDARKSNRIMFEKKKTDEKNVDHMKKNKLSK